MLRASTSAVDIVTVTNDPHELSAYQKATAGAKTLPVKMDADGCFYGFRFMLLTKLIVHTHRSSLMKIESMEQSERNKLLDSIRNLIATTPIEEWSNTDSRKRPACEARVAEKELHFHILKLKLLHPDLLYDILYRVNRQLVEKIMRRALQDQCEVIVFMFGTNRHSLERDKFNAAVHGTGYFMEDMHHFTRYLNERFHQQILFMLDRFLVADAYNKLPAGETFHRAIKHFSCSDEQLVHVDSIFDQSKVNILLCVHRIKILFPGANAVLMFDDDDDIIEMLKEVFQHEHCLQLLPDQLPVTITLYDGDFYDSFPDTVIQGKGEVDPNCEHTLRHLLRLSTGCGINELKKSERAIQFDNPELLARLLQYLKLLRSSPRLSSAAPVCHFHGSERLFVSRFH